MDAIIFGIQLAMGKAIFGLAVILAGLLVAGAIVLVSRF